MQVIVTAINNIPNNYINIKEKELKLKIGSFCGENGI